MPEFTDPTAAVASEPYVPESAATAVIQLHEVTREFHQGAMSVMAVRGVSFSIARPQFVAIMGASGSGKSTLLHLTAGLTAPTSGTVLVHGTDIGALRDPRRTVFRRQHIGIVFQAFNLVPTLSAADNVELPVLAGAESGPLDVDEILKLVGMTDRREHRPDQLSGGEQQRVAIARALMTDPPVILADEPTGNLDSANSVNVCELLQSLQKKHEKTVVVVTHEPEVAMWADRVLVLRDGMIVADCATRDYSTPQDLATHYHELLRAS